MDFKIKPLNIIAQILQGKFSIRVSILTIVLSLLIGISILIIGINYLAVNSILIASAKNSLLQSSGKVAEQIKYYLQPLNDNAFTAHQMVSKKVVIPKDPAISDFLYSLIADDENIVGAYWGDINGNIYWVNRDPNGYYEKIILRSQNKVIFATKKYLNQDGIVVASQKLDDTSYDPRLRPWYKEAQKEKKLTWVVYGFVQIGNQPPQIGITSAFPVYNSQGKLQGVFGSDMLLGTIDRYIKAIDITKNSYIFVINPINGDLIATYTGQSDKSQGKVIPNITGIQAPSIIESFRLYKEKTESPFVFSVNHKQYIAAYQKIGGVKGNIPWLVAIVTPIQDVIAPLYRSLLIGGFFTIMALLFGVLLASIFSSSLSLPIKTLAHDANLICQLQLASIRHLFSRITEIADMADSFIKMRNALYSFQRYMPINLVKKLVISNKIATVGGEAKNLTIFFTDIRHFTKLSEGFDPEKLMHFLSEYFQSLTKVVNDMGGTVDKYIGDGMMAFWGAPIDDQDHIEHACQAALLAQVALKDLNSKWHREGKPEVITNIGINTGRVVVGNVGSDYKLNYTSIGDPVNLASRLEGLNKIYGTSIMVSEFVYEKVQDKFIFRLVDRVAVKGKTQGVNIYELLGERGNILDPKWEIYNQRFVIAFKNYQQGDWLTALNLFNELSKNFSNDPVAKIFITRCTKLVSEPPNSWNGIWIMEEK